MDKAKMWMEIVPWAIILINKEHQPQKWEEQEIF